MDILAFYSRDSISFRPSIFQAVFTVTTEILADTKPTASDLFAIY